MRNKVVLPGAVGADDADDAAGRKRERHVLNQQIVAVSFADSVRFDHDVAQTRSRRNVNLQIFAPLLRLLSSSMLRKR